MNSALMVYSVLPVLAFVLTAMGTACIGHILFERKMFDIPNERSSHTAMTPRGGGLSIVAVFFLFSLGASLYDGLFESLGPVFLAMIVIAGIGVLDDRRHIAPLLRICAHLFAVAICLAALGVPSIPVWGIDLNMTWLLYLLAIIAWIWCINLFNFMDGIDGIASVQAITVSLSAAALIVLTALQASPWVFYLLLLAAVAAGFLVWNWSPARIFMGDAASGFFGFILGLFALVTSIEGSMNVWSWLILMGAFVVDATMTLLTRFLRQEVWYQAHRQHVYQRWVMLIQQVESTRRPLQQVRVLAHRSVNIIFIAINLLWLLPWAALANTDVQHAPLYAAFALAPLLVLAGWVQYKCVGE